MTAFPGLRRRSTLFALAAILAARRARAEDGIVDALGRRVALKAGTGGDRVVGFSKTLWVGWRPSIYARYLKPIARLAELADVGNTDDNTFSLDACCHCAPISSPCPNGRPVAREHGEAGEHRTFSAVSTVAHSSPVGSPHLRTSTRKQNGILDRKNHYGV